ASVALADLPSFPTRRSSDLEALKPVVARFSCALVSHHDRDKSFARVKAVRNSGCSAAQLFRVLRDTSSASAIWAMLLPSRPSSRSEEHTSELQSRENLVCRL